MKIYPTIEIMNGRAVDRVDGSHVEPQIFEVTPLEAARMYAEAGAEYIHVVDVDGTLHGGRPNADQIREIIDKVHVQVQVAGGIRTVDSVRWWFDKGAYRVGLGTAAVKDRGLVRDACAAYPDRILVTIAVRGDRVVVEGWREDTSFFAADLAKDLENLGVAEIVFVDLDRDRRPQEFSLAKTMRLGESVSIPVISSGTVASLDDVAMLKYLPNIGGCIIGRALFHGNVELSAAIATAQASYTRARLV